MESLSFEPLHYILMVRCGAELAVVEDLKERGFSASCPTFTYRRKIRYRKALTTVPVSRPAIDGYVFVASETVTQLDLLRNCEGVLKLVTFSGIPATITQAQLRTVVELGIRLDYQELTTSERRELMRKQKGFEGLRAGERISIFFGAISLNGIFVGDGMVEVEIMGRVFKIRLQDAYVQRQDVLESTGSLDDKGVIPVAR